MGWISRIGGRSTHMEEGRRFTIFDAIILVAATAVGMAGIRCCLLLGYSAEPRRPEEGWSIGGISSVLSHTFFLSQPLLAAWVLAVFLLRLRRPRPQLRRLVLQPGTVVCIATVLGTAKGAIHMLARSFVIWITEGWNVWDENLDIPGPLASASLRAWGMIFGFVICESEIISFGVVLAWIILALSRRWRPEPGWVDRVGRVLGVLWIVTALACWYIGDVEQRDMQPPHFPVWSPSPFDLPP